MAVRAAPVSLDEARTRKQDVRGEVSDLRVELTAHRVEALAFCDSIGPLVDRLHMVALEIGPLAAQTVMTLAARIDRYERRHLLPEPDAA